MGASYLERELLSACPSFRVEWERLRATYGGEPPEAADFLSALRAHVLMLLAAGRVAEVTRLFYAFERLLAGADPVLEELLVGSLVAPLARDCRDEPSNALALLPHLGARTRRAWDAATIQEA